MEDDFNLLSPQLWVTRTLQNAIDARKYGCDGLIGVHWRTKILAPQMQALAYIGWNGTLDVKAFYDDFAISNFGEGAAPEISAIFRKIDSNLPVATDWGKDGYPGGIHPDPAYWDKEKTNYSFVEEMEKIRPGIVGAGNLERFDYYLNQYRYLRSLGRLKSSIGTPDEDKDLRDVLNYLMESSYTTGELGNISNITRQMMGKERQRNYTGNPHLIVLTPRTCLEPDEDLDLDVMFLEKGDPKKVTLFWREIGEKSFHVIKGQRKELNHFFINLAAEEISGKDIEYYINGLTSDDENIYFPASSPERGLTIVQMTTDIPANYLINSHLKTGINE